MLAAVVSGEEASLPVSQAGGARGQARGSEAKASRTRPTAASTTDASVPSTAMRDEC
jgi:hypothetical protein